MHPTETTTTPTNTITYKGVQRKKDLPDRLQKSKTPHTYNTNTYLYNTYSFNKKKKQKVAHYKWMKWKQDLQRIAITIIRQKQNEDVIHVNIMHLLQIKFDGLKPKYQFEVIKNDAFQLKNFLTKLHNNTTQDTTINSHDLNILINFY